MKTLSRLGALLAASALVLAAAPKPLVVDGTSGETFVASVGRMQDALPAEKRERFTNAIAAIGMDLAVKHDPKQPYVPNERGKLLNGMTADQVIAKASTLPPYQPVMVPPPTPSN